MNDSNHPWPPGPAQWPGAPPTAWVTAQPSVLGVALEPGERVLWYDRRDYRAHTVIFWILGVLLLVFVVGLVFIGLALWWAKSQPRGAFMTDRRVVTVDPRGTPTSVALHALADIEVSRPAGDKGDPVDGMLIGEYLLREMATIPSHLNAQMRLDAFTRIAKAANWQAKFRPSHWRGAAIVLIGRNGVRARVETDRASELGPLLMQVCSNPAIVGQIPSVAVVA